MERFSPLAKAKNICCYFFIKSFPGVIYKLLTRRKKPRPLDGRNGTLSYLQHLLLIMINQSKAPDN